jgi:hypothetical protein
VLIGKLSLDEEQNIVAETKTWVEEHSETIPSYRHYLNHWGDWQRPGE